VQDPVPRAFDEKAYRRAALATWDAKWHGLSVQARYFFLNVVKGPFKDRAYSNPISVAVDKFPPRILTELTAAGFVEVQPPTSSTATDRVIACQGVYDFAVRVRSLPRLHLLAADQPSEFMRYVDRAFYGTPLMEVLADVLRGAGIDAVYRDERALLRYVMRHHWPGWVAQLLEDPLAERVLNVVREAGGPVLLADLAGRIERGDPGRVHSAVSKLVSHLALVEDLQAQTWELMVGFLPTVREEMTRASQPRVRPPLVVCECPKEVAPDGSAIIDDVRAVLLEVVSEPPRIRQDRSLFQKELDRFQTRLEPLPVWLLQALHWSDEGRLNQALAWSSMLKLVKIVPEKKQARLGLTSKGHAWLASGLAEQYIELYKLLTTFAPGSGHEWPQVGSFSLGRNPFGGMGHCDRRFLGEDVGVLRADVQKGVRGPFYWEAKPVDFQALRESLDQALATLKPGVYYRLDSALSHLVFGEHNPLNRGLAPNRTAVFWESRSVPPLQEQREEAGQRLIDTFVRERLIPLGCVRVAIDDAGKICIARQPRYDAYFGREVGRADMAPGSDVAAKVVVQPDFSVVLIGQSPVSAAEMAPFCVRTTRGGAQGASVLKITRESVIKAVSHGLQPVEIVDRLERHASNKVPANVLREVRDWSSWVRQVTSTTLTVLRCPDAETADRVMAALKRRAERVNATLVALDVKKLTAAERNKLQSHGIIVQTEFEALKGRSSGREES